MSDSNLQEVLQVTVATDQFKAGLEQLAKMWQDFVAQVGEGNVFGAGVLGGIVDGLNEVKAAFDAVAADLAAVTASFATQVTTAIDETASSAIKNSTLLKQDAEARADFDTKQDAERLRAMEQRDSAATRSAEKQKALAEEIAIQQQGLDDQFKAGQELDAEAAAAKTAKIAGLQKELADLITIEQQGITDQYILQQEKEVAANAAKAAKIAAAQKALAEEIIIEQQGIVDQYNASQEKKASGGARGGSLVEDLSRVAKYYLLWAAISDVMQGLGAIIAAPFKAIQEGNEYLSKTNQIAEQLSGVLLANGHFSNDTAENLDKARLAAAGLVRELQDIGVKDNLKFESLTTIFKILTESGGGKLGQSVGDLGKLTEVFAILEKQVTATGGNARTFYTDISKALEGTLPPSSKLLDVLGMTAEQFKALIEQAKLHHNALELLAPSVEKYMDANQRASLTQGELIEKVELLKQRWEALAAGPVYEEINNALKSIIEWVNKNTEQIYLMAEALGKVALSSVVVIETLFSNPSGLSFIGAMTNEFLYFEAIVLKTVLAIDRLKVAFADWNEKKLPVDPETGLIGGDGSKSNDDQTPSLAYMDRHDKLAADTQAIAEAMAKLADAKRAVDAASSGDASKLGADAAAGLQRALDFKYDQDKNNPSLDKAKKAPSETPDDLALFEGELEAKRQAQEQFQADQKRLVLLGAESQAQATANIKRYLQEETIAVAKLVEKYQDLVNKQADLKDPKSTQKAKTTTDRLNNTGNRFIGGLYKTMDSSDDDHIRAGKKVENEQNTQDLATVQKNLRAELEAKKAALQEGKITQEEYLQQEIIAETAAHVVRQAIYDRELQQAGPDERAAVLHKKTDDEDIYTASVLRLTGERIEAHRKELEEEAKHSVNLSNSHEQFKGSLEDMGAAEKHEVSGAAFASKQEEISLSIKQTEAALRHADSLGTETKRVRELEDALAGLNAKRLAAGRSEIGVINSSTDPNWMKQQNRGEVYGNLKTGLQDQLGNAKDRLHAGEASPDTTSETMEKLHKEVQAASDALSALDAVIKDVSPSLSNLGQSIVRTLAGFDYLGKMAQDTGNAIAQIQDTVQALSHAFTEVTTTLSAIKQGGRQGGVLGGIGGAISANSDLIAQIPVAGPIIAALGPVLSTLGQMFMSATIRMANDIKAAISTSTTAYALQAQNLATTINQLKSEEVTAISELSGAKGGQAQLKQILPQLQQQIAQLEVQQQQIEFAFQYAATSLYYQVSEQTDALSTVYDKWVQINQQANDYINAGGIISIATTYLSNQLTLIAKQSQDTLNAGQQQAVQDAIGLNNLLFQRFQLVQSLNNQAFALENQDAEERTQAGAVTRADQLKLLQQNSQQQLLDLNYQIQTGQLKVDAESQVFVLAQSIADLHSQDDILTLKTLNEQLAGYTALQSLVKSISFDPTTGNIFSSLPWLQPIQSTIAGAPTITLTGGVVVNVVAPANQDPAQTGQTVADAVVKEISAAARNAAW